VSGKLGHIHTGYHGVFAPASALRGAVTPAGRGRGAPAKREATEPQAPKHVQMTWMQRLRRVFAIDIQTCRRCGGQLKVIASIEDPGLVEHILAHLERPAEAAGLPPFASRAPPQPPLL